LLHYNDTHADQQTMLSLDSSRSATPHHAYGDASDIPTADPRPPALSQKVNNMLSAIVLSVLTFFGVNCAKGDDAQAFLDFGASDPIVFGWMVGDGDCQV
jgi:hypothetical protein